MFQECGNSQYASGALRDIPNTAHVTTGFEQEPDSQTTTQVAFAGKAPVATQRHNERVKNQTNSNLSMILMWRRVALAAHWAMQGEKLLPCGLHLNRLFLWASNERATWSSSRRRSQKSWPCKVVHPVMLCWPHFTTLRELGRLLISQSLLILCACIHEFLCYLSHKENIEPHNESDAEGSL